MLRQTDLFFCNCAQKIQPTTRTGDVERFADESLSMPCQASSLTLIIPVSGVRHEALRLALSASQMQPSKSYSWLAGHRFPTSGR
ncbi:hypothetical protein PoB_001719700 [Plakobranchus ocellatus]|uniref:Uncharacterized protein n=1 Tax=Plakobranchus ocellatus TaxID=259542 RepID=A0AAV3Z5Z7_9GAST|nr:hypothetical protein PoB_001719700 [Plakobranchus ocellatus]